MCCYEDCTRGFDPNELVDESGRVGDLAAPVQRLTPTTSAGR
jgi:hypothetical protein